MKKSLFLAILLTLPLFASAYDALTPREDLLSLVPNSNFLLRDEYKKYCDTEQVRIESEIAKVINEYDGYQESIKVSELTREQQVIVTKCNETKTKIENQLTPIQEQNRLVGCGPAYVKRGGECITPTQACQIYFGTHVTGIKSLSDQNVAECTCNIGYSLKGLCTANLVPTLATVAGTSTLDREALISSLIAQILVLMEQLKRAQGF